jgi:hypothetical protein
MFFLRKFSGPPRVVQSFHSGPVLAAARVLARRLLAVRELVGTLMDAPESLLGAPRVVALLLLVRSHEGTIADRGTKVKPKQHFFLFLFS